MFKLDFVMCLFPTGISEYSSLLTRALVDDGRLLERSVLSSLLNVRYKLQRRTLLLSCSLWAESPILRLKTTARARTATNGLGAQFTGSGQFERNSRSRF